MSTIGGCRLTRAFWGHSSWSLSWSFRVLQNNLCPPFSTGGCCCTCSFLVKVKRLAIKAFHSLFLFFRCHSAWHSILNILHCIWSYYYRSVNDMEKPLGPISDDYTCHVLKPSVHYPLGYWFQDSAHSVKLCPCCLTVGWSQLNPLEYTTGVWKLCCLEGLGSMGWYLAGLLLHLTKIWSCALKHVLLPPRALHPGRMYF